ncbi:YecA/YgfB family protein [Pseudomonas brassicacearum]|uniref:YecA/YgfB family protein n=1 Tax=Pseudomonas brassicacearum TaxID=930166 RepID=UPI00064046E3|nr:SEC-C metal-binding domain-containing protein [Pseudomonas brassicacearum]
MFNAAKSESEVIAELIELTSQPGYVHALALICHRDNGVTFQDEYKASDMEHLYSSSRLNRNEFTTLLGLMVRQPLELSIPDNETLILYMSRTDTLMQELHNSMSVPMFDSMLKEAKGGTETPILWHGAAMREPIFYCAESAYSFQYRDFFLEKHTPDDEWLLNNKGFDSNQAHTIANSMCSIIDSRATTLYRSIHEARAQPETYLSLFEFTPSEVSERSKQSIDTVNAFFNALTLQGNNHSFQEIGDFNAVTATPLIPTNRGTVLLFLHYSLYEALYESPFFWMLADETYKQTALDHRGDFTENFSYRRLQLVFGKSNVHKNVNLLKGKKVIGEADVLVIYGDRLIIVQAKSKKLTLAARKGSDGQLKKDFAAAIEKANEQAWECATAIVDGDCILKVDTGHKIALPKSIKEIFPFCVVSDHYPALAFQANELLKYRSTDVIQRPLVMDVFLLDVLTEMLSSPLYLLSYLRHRATVKENIWVSHELTALAFHLKCNLLLEPNVTMMMLHDDIASELDAAMTVRREGFPGAATPSGILTKMQGTLYEKLISQIEKRPEPAILALGFLLLSLHEDSCRNVHEALKYVTTQTKADSANHNVALGITEKTTGVCIHCNFKPSLQAVQTLDAHCHKRKYSFKAQSWYGVSVDPNGELQFGVTLDFPWAHSEEMDILVQGMKPASIITQAKKILKQNIRPHKLGRNDLCSCGSGKKFKKCCMI